MSRNADHGRHIRAPPAWDKANPSALCASAPDIHLVAAAAATRGAGKTAIHSQRGASKRKHNDRERLSSPAVVWNSEGRTSESITRLG